MGKTTLLCRIAAELRKPDYQAQFLPLTFPEEQYIEIDRLSKLWLNCLDAMADALEAMGDRATARDLDAQVRQLDRGPADETARAEQTRAAFQAAIARVGRRPVLLLDNLHLLLQRLREHDYVLRGFFTRRVRRCWWAPPRWCPSRCRTTGRPSTTASRPTSCIACRSARCARSSFSCAGGQPAGRRRTAACRAASAACVAGPDRRQPADDRAAVRTVRARLFGRPVRGSGGAAGSGHALVPIAAGSAVGAGTTAVRRPGAAVVSRDSRAADARDATAARQHLAATGASGSHRPGREGGRFSRQEDGLSDCRTVLQHLVPDAICQPPPANGAGVLDAISARVLHAARTGGPRSPRAGEGRLERRRSDLCLGPGRGDFAAGSGPRSADAHRTADPPPDRRHPGADRPDHRPHRAVAAGHRFRRTAPQAPQPGAGGQSRLARRVRGPGAEFRFVGPAPPRIRSPFDRRSRTALARAGRGACQDHRARNAGGGSMPTRKKPSPTC